ncbi:unnamed protein product [marine sediment metagenome]|uniref:Uncharacterized protein n=1 Tax=marine sediment metagenome TaxID=412755 RepID=X1VN92_9ZZZZ
MGTNVSFWSTLGSGVLGGLLATFLILVFAKYWKQVIIPWYEDRVYKDIRIAGKWRTKGEHNKEVFEENARICQKAHRVWGNIIYKTEKGVADYEFEGEFKNLILTARYWVKEENNLDRGTFTLMLRNNG